MCLPGLSHSRNFQVSLRLSLNYSLSLRNSIQQVLTEGLMQTWMRACPAASLALRSAAPLPPDSLAVLHGTGRSCVWALPVLLLPHLPGSPSHFPYDLLPHPQEKAFLDHSLREHPSQWFSIFFPSFTLLRSTCYKLAHSIFCAFVCFSSAPRERKLHERGRCFSPVVSPILRAGQGIWQALRKCFLSFSVLWRTCRQGATPTAFTGKKKLTQITKIRPHSPRDSVTGQRAMGMQETFPGETGAVSWFCRADDTALKSWHGSRGHSG